MVAGDGSRRFPSTRPGQNRGGFAQGWRKAIVEIERVRGQEYGENKLYK